jgi:hypothetical protein
MIAVAEKQTGTVRDADLLPVGHLHPETAHPRLCEE